VRLGESEEFMVGVIFVHSRDRLEVVLLFGGFRTGYTQKKYIFRLA
jgi:hypothetical protein